MLVFERLRSRMTGRQSEQDGQQYRGGRTTHASTVRIQPPFVIGLHGSAQRFHSAARRLLRVRCNGWLGVNSRSLARERPMCKTSNLLGDEEACGVSFIFPIAQ